MRRGPIRFSTQVLLFQLGILGVVVVGGLGLMALLLRADLIDQYEQRALAIGRSVAADDRYAAALKAGDPAGVVARRAEAVRRRTGALFVVVTDERGIRFSHPDPDLIGKQVSADQAQALDGREVVTYGASAAGTSARGKVPLRNATGGVVGEVIVAIPASQIGAHLADLLREAAAFLGLAFILGAAGAVALTRVVKGQTLGLDPASLRQLWEQQAALRRVATLAATGDDDPKEVFEGAAVEVGRVHRARATALLRYEADGTASVVAVGGEVGVAVPAGARLSLGDDDLAARVLDTCLPVRMDGARAAHGSVAAVLEGLAVGTAVGAPIVVEGSVWGAMVAAWSPATSVPFGVEAQIAAFTDLLATAIANANSRAELAASRARLVAAGDDARRRIERDLHDGTQQRLVSLGLDLGAAESAVPPELPELKAQLARAVVGLGQTMEDLQEITRGIHPAILSKGGLSPALRALARRSPVAVEIDVGIDRRLPDRVEVAAYYVVAEALTNAAKHARSSVVRVEVDVEAGALLLSIADDGVGGADPDKGSGLLGLRDRVEALGGRFRVASVAGAGTSLSVTIPIT